MEEPAAATAAAAAAAAELLFGFLFLVCYPKSLDKRNTNCDEINLTWIPSLRIASGRFTP